MGEPDRLRALEVSVAGCKRIDVLFRELDQRPAQVIDGQRDALMRCERVQTQVRRHLIVAAARGV